MGEFRRMGRIERKTRDGVECPVCPLHVHFLDMIAYRHEGDEYYMHDKCAALIIDGTVIPEEDSAAAGDELTEADFVEVPRPE